MDKPLALTVSFDSLRKTVEFWNKMADKIQKNTKIYYFLNVLKKLKNYMVPVV